MTGAIPVKRMIIYACIIIIATYLVMVAAMYLRQDGLIYFPGGEISRTPDTVNIAYGDIRFSTKDGFAISGWYIPADRERGTVIVCNGNAGTISDRIDLIKIFHDLNLSVLIFDYRGYGKSEGKPSENGTYLDAEAAWDYLVNIQKKPPEKIVVYGQSLGGAVATELALRKGPAALIVESSFTSLPDLAAQLYPWMPVRLISKYHYATIDKIGRIRCPKLIVHSPDDEIVPYRHGTALYEKALPPKEFIVIRGGHNDGIFVSIEKYKEGLREFFEKYLQ